MNRVLKLFIRNGYLALFVIVTVIYPFTLQAQEVSDLTERSAGMSRETVAPTRKVTFHITDLDGYPVEGIPVNASVSYRKWKLGLFESSHILPKFKPHVSVPATDTILIGFTNVDGQLEIPAGRVSKHGVASSQLEVVYRADSVTLNRNSHDGSSMTQQRVSVGYNCKVDDSQLTDIENLSEPIVIQCLAYSFDLPVEENKVEDSL